MTDFGKAQPFVVGLDDWLAQIAGNGGAWTSELRRAAMQRFTSRGVPGPKDEDWRHIPLQLLTNAQRVVLDGPASIDADVLEAFAIQGLDAIRVVLVDGFLVPELSDLSRLPKGLEVVELYEGMAARRALLEPGLERANSDDSTSFESLNAAWCRGGVIVNVAPNAVIEPTVHLLCVSTAQHAPSMTHPRIVLHTGRSAQWSLVEDHVVVDDSDAFVNLVVESSLEDNAQLDHVKLVRTGSRHVHMASTRTEQGRDSRLNSVAVTFDGALVRHDIRSHLRGTNSDVTLNGLVLLDAAQIVDNHSWIFHDTTRTTSHQHYRNVLDGRSRAVFAGRVVVAEGASGTDAEQSNANLLLSDDAQVNTLPQLEIYNDDVKASHGATLGQLDLDALFYMRSRGISEEAARGLLTFAFANAVVETVPLSAVRDLVRRSVFEHLPHEHLSEDLV